MTASRFVAALAVLAVAGAACEKIAGVRDLKASSAGAGGSAVGGSGDASAGSAGGGGLGGTGAGGAGAGGVRAGSGGAAGNGNDGSAAGGAGEGGSDAAVDGGADAPGLDGQLGTGGQAATGGMTGAGGATGTGGMTGAGGSPCTTSFPGVLASTFDTAGDTEGWKANSTPMISGQTVTQTSSDGHTCPGALSSTFPFTSYGQQGSFVLSLGSTSLAGRKALHLWLKVPPPTAGYSVLLGLQLFVQSGGFTVFNTQFAATTVFSDGNWHEVVFSFAAAVPAVMLNDVGAFGVQVITVSSQPAGAPAAPGSVTVLMDDVWVENGSA